MQNPADRAVARTVRGEGDQTLAAPDSNTANAGIAVGASALDLVPERAGVEEVVEASEHLVLRALEVLCDEAVVPDPVRALEDLLVAALRHELEAFVQVGVEAVHDQIG